MLHRDIVLDSSSSLLHLYEAHCLKITQDVPSFWHFLPIFVELKLTCLVTLFDRKLHLFKKVAKFSIFGIFNEM